MAAEYLKIGLVLDDSLDKTDGVQQYVLALGGWLNSQGHEVHYLVGETNRVDMPRVHSLAKNLSVRFNGNRMSMPLPGSAGRLQQLLREEAFDVLHVQVPYSPFLAGRIIQAASPMTAVIGTFHILPNSKAAAIANRCLALWCRRSLKRFDKVVSVSSAAQEFARHTYGLTTEVVPNVFDYERFHTAGTHASPASERTILFFGRLVARKGCQLLLEATRILAAEPDLPPFRVVVCGKGPLEPALRRYVESHGLAERVTFKGYIEESDKPGYYASADIAVFPSSGGESFGIVLVEAMASGRAAVLAGNNPGYASVMKPRPDLLFDPYDAAGLAAKLKVYLTDDTARRDTAAWGAAYSRRFDIELVGKQVLDIYKQSLHVRRNMR